MYWGIGGLVEYLQTSSVVELRILGLSAFKRVGKYRSILGIEFELQGFDWFDEFHCTKDMPENHKDFLRMYENWQQFQDALISCVGEKGAISVGLITIPEAVVKMFEIKEKR